MTEKKLEDHKLETTEEAREVHVEAEDKKFKKLPVVIILAVLGIVILAISIVTILLPELAHNQVYPGEENYGERGNAMLVTHQSQDCATCHEGHDPVADGNDFCFTCHDNDMEKLQQATAEYPINPHNFYHGEEDCASCHKVHDTSVLTCAGCHDNMADGLPDSGWDVPEPLM